MGRGNISRRIDTIPGEGELSYKHRLKIWDMLLKGPYLQIPLPYINILELKTASLLTLFVKISEEVGFIKMCKELKRLDKEARWVDDETVERDDLQWDDTWFSITTKQITERTSLSKREQGGCVGFLIEKNLLEKTRKNSLNYYKVNFEEVHNLIDEYENKIDDNLYGVVTVSGIEMSKK